MGAGVKARQRRAADTARLPAPGEAWRVHLRAADVGTERTCVVRVRSVAGDRMAVLVCGALVEIEVAWRVCRVKRAETPEKGSGAA